MTKAGLENRAGSQLTRVEWNTKRGAKTVDGGVGTKFCYDRRLFFRCRCSGRGSIS